MQSFTPTNHHLRELSIYFINWKKSVAAVHRLFVKAYDETTSSESSCHEWFGLEDKERKRRLIPYTKVKVALEEDSSQTQKELAFTLEMTKKDSI